MESSCRKVSCRWDQNGVVNRDRKYREPTPRKLDYRVVPFSSTSSV